MKTIELPGGAGTVVFTGTDAEAAEHERVLRARHEFAMGYCRSKGWPEDAAQLSIEQILEVRAQEGWKNP